MAALLTAFTHFSPAGSATANDLFQSAQFGKVHIATVESVVPCLDVQADTFGRRHAVLRTNVSYLCNKVFQFFHKLAIGGEVEFFIIDGVPFYHYAFAVLWQSLIDFLCDERHKGMQQFENFVQKRTPTPKECPCVQRPSVPYSTGLVSSMYQSQNSLQTKSNSVWQGKSEFELFDEVRCLTCNVV